MKMRTLVAALLIGVLVNFTSHVTFALDTGPSKVPKTEMCSVNDLSSGNYETYFAVPTESYIFPYEGEVTKMTYSVVNHLMPDALITPVDLPLKVGWCSTNDYYIISTTENTLSDPATQSYCYSNREIWKEKIKQCIFHSERSPKVIS